MSSYSIISSISLLYQLNELFCLILTNIGKIDEFRQQFDNIRHHLYTILTACRHHLSTIADPSVVTFAQAQFFVTLPKHPLRRSFADNAASHQCRRRSAAMARGIGSSPRLAGTAHPTTGGGCVRSRAAGVPTRATGGRATGGGSAGGAATGGGATCGGATGGAPTSFLVVARRSRQVPPRRFGVGVRGIIVDATATGLDGIL